MYHRQYGLPEERVFAGSMPIDSTRLVASAGDAASARREIRERHGIPEDAFVVVYAGKLTELKCPLHLLEAIHLCTQRGLKIWGLLVGEGAERSALEAFIIQRKMKNIVLAGFVNQSSLGKYYAASEALALMSRYEAKGLVVPEAGCFGLPVILSDRVGCIGPTDSARPGENALVYPWSDIDALANCIARICLDQRLYGSMSKAARKIADSQDIVEAAMQLKQAAMRLKTIGCRR
jgi:glycosyltransferase involved in cell wall biosynthesis